VRIPFDEFCAVLVCLQLEGIVLLARRKDSGEIGFVYIILKSSLLLVLEYAISAIIGSLHILSLRNTLYSSLQ
jgi:hypothetical protein